MKPSKKVLVIVILLAGIILVMAGAFLKTRNLTGAAVILVAGFIVSIISVLSLVPAGREAQRIQPPDNLRKTLLHLSFSIGFGITVYTVFIELTGTPKNTVLLALCGITTLIFLMMVLSEVLGSTRLNRYEKIVWTISMVLFHYFAGLMYLLRGRRYTIAEFSGGTD
jgi:hypothetical protein